MNQHLRTQLQYALLTSVLLFSGCADDSSSSGNPAPGVGSASLKRYNCVSQSSSTNQVPMVIEVNDDGSQITVDPAEAPQVFLRFSSETNSETYRGLRDATERLRVQKALVDGQGAPSGHLDYAGEDFLCQRS